MNLSSTDALPGQEKSCLVLPDILAPCLHLRTLFLLEVVLAKNKVCPSEISGSDMLAVETGGRMISQGPGFYYKGDAIHSIYLLQFSWSVVPNSLRPHGP